MTSSVSALRIFFIAFISVMSIAPLSRTQAAENTVVVTATRVEQSGFDLPVSIDAFDRERIQGAQPQVNLSEVLLAAPGVIANNRQNYAQDLQISVRGFGARSTFGIRGVRLYADGIPLTMPDGQGQAGNVDLSSAQRIEVMRGPFSALYGNSSGGVIQVFTEDARAPFEMTGGVWASAFDSSRLNLKIGGKQGRANYLLDLSRFDTEGFRDHSAVTRDTANGKLKLDLGDRTRLTFIASYLNQPGTQDPLGLTRAEMLQDREQAGNGALAQNTRKDIENSQAGAVLEQTLSSKDSLRLLSYYGERSVRQFLALTFAGRGVVDLNRNFGGVDARWTRQTMLSSRPFTFTAGLNYDRMREIRRGFTNAAGELGALGRDENNLVSNLDPYAQAQWDVADSWSLSGGLRHSRVRFDTQDRFINAGNGDDSGTIEFSDTTPVAGVLYKVTPTLNVYANGGQSFETPTFAELAYRSVSATSTGFNFALKPAISRNYEAGMKARIGERARLNAAVFRTNTRDEIAVLVNQGGRSVFQNVDRTRREGVELALDGSLAQGWRGLLSYTYLDARFENNFLTCGANAACAAPNFTVPAGNRIPGVPRNNVYAELSWSYPRFGLSTAVEAHWMDSVFTNDLNDEAAASYALLNWRVSLEQKTHGGWTWREFLRLENALNKQYEGSVIVNASNAQYYEPAPGRTLMLGFSVRR